MQERLEVSPEQANSLLEARRRLLKAVSKIREDRERQILELGLALLRQQQQEVGHLPLSSSCP